MTLTKVLLVEDNAGDEELVRAHLTRAPGAPYEIHATDSLEAAIESCEATSPDVVLLDLNLPDSGGLETIDLFRARVPNAPVVVLTGLADIELALDALRRGADDYVAKDGISSDVLARTIRYAIERRRMVASLETERATVAMLQEVGAALASELDRERLVQKITDLATRLVGGSFGAFIYNASGTGDPLYALSGASREAFENLGLLQATPLLDPPFRGQATLRSDDVRLDPRFGRTSSYEMRADQLAVASCLAVPVALRGGAIVGMLLFGHPERARFTIASERIAVGVAGWAGVAMDNARLYEEALDAARARENLLQVVSHDLRNHVNTMQLGLRILGKRIGADNTRGLAAVERASSTMRRLLEDLVDIAAIEKGVLSVHPSLLDAHELLEGGRALLVPAIESKGIEASWSSPEAGITVWADGERILQILENLVGNAMKFTPAGGRISVACTSSADDVVVEVADTGPGIPEADRTRIFDRFFRGSRPKGHGAGLGLAITRALVEAHGGHITFESVVGGGTAFRVALRRTEPETRS